MSLWPSWIKFFRSFQNNFGLWPNPPPKKTDWNTVKCVACLLLRWQQLLHTPSNQIMFSMSWFNLAKMAWAVEQTPNLKTAQLDNGFWFLIGKPTTRNQLNLCWNIYCFIEINIPNNWAFWIFFTPSTMTFWRCFKECLWLTLMSRMLWPHTFLRCPEAKLLLSNTVV